MAAEMPEVPAAGGADAEAALSEGEWMAVVCAAGPDPAVAAAAAAPGAATAAVNSSGVEPLLLRARDWP